MKPILKTRKSKPAAAPTELLLFIPLILGVVLLAQTWNGTSAEVQTQRAASAVAQIRVSADPDEASIWEEWLAAEIGDSGFSCETETSEDTENEALSEIVKLEVECTVFGESAQASRSFRRVATSRASRSCEASAAC